MAEEKGREGGQESTAPEAGHEAAAGPSSTGSASAGPGRRGRRRAPRSTGAPRTGALLVFALAVGGTAGWFAKHAHARTGQATSDAGVAASCAAWEQEICGGVGEEALACYEAKAAANLLPPAACEAALEAVPETLSKAAAGREVCNTVIDRLCTDLGPDTPTCSVVREKTQLFPAERCQEMLDNYDQVIDELRMFQQQMSPGPVPPPGVDAPAPGMETPSADEGQEPPANAEPGDRGAPGEAPAAPAP